MHVGIGELPWHFTLLYELHLDIYMISNSDVGGLVSQLASSPEFIIILIYSVALGNLPILYIYIYRQTWLPWNPGMATVAFCHDYNYEMDNWRYTLRYAGGCGITHEDLQSYAHWSFEAADTDIITGIPMRMRIIYHGSKFTSLIPLLYM